MVNFKIVETMGTFPDVLLHRYRNENGEEFVKILAVGVVDGFSDIIISEIIQFENNISASSFIEDFSVNSANKWCKKNDVKY